jgi:hypothetical protein
MANLETSYLAVRGAVVDAIEEAWSPVAIYHDPFQLPEGYADFPVVFMDASITSMGNETAVTDEIGIAWTITGIFESDGTNGNDLAFIGKVQLAQAELYAVLNMGNYGYLGQMTEAQRIDLDGNERFGVQFVYSCSLSVER